MNWLDANEICEFYHEGASLQGQEILPYYLIRDLIFHIPFCQLIPSSSASATQQYNLFQIHGFRVQFDDAENIIAPYLCLIPCRAWKAVLRWRFWQDYIASASNKTQNYQHTVLCVVIIN